MIEKASQHSRGRYILMIYAIESTASDFKAVYEKYDKSGHHDMADWSTAINLIFSFMKLYLISLRDFRGSQIISPDENCKW